MTALVEPEPHPAAIDRTVSAAGTRQVEQASDGRTIRLEPGGPIYTLPADAGMPDPMLEYRHVLE